MFLSSFKSRKSKLRATGPLTALLFALAISFAAAACNAGGGSWWGETGTPSSGPGGGSQSYGDYPDTAGKISADLSAWAETGLAKTAELFEGETIIVAQMDKSYNLLESETASLSVLAEANSVKIISPAPALDVYLFVGYDPSKVSPRDVSLGGAFEGGGEYISIAVKGTPGHVAVGLASLSRVAPSEAGTVSVEFQHKPFKQTNSRKPASDRDDEIGIMIADMYVMPGMQGSNELSWQVILQGDLDGNGEVGIPDITPIALNYGNIFGDGIGDEVDWYLNWASGRDDEIGIADITPIAMNYLSSGPVGYDVFKVWTGDGTVEHIQNELSPDDPTMPGSMGETSEMAPQTFAMADTSSSGPSSLRRSSMINNEGDGWAFGDFYYVLDPRAQGETEPPSGPRKTRFNVHVRYDSPFRIESGGEVTMSVRVFGAESVSSYFIDWGDRTRETIDTGEFEVSVSHVYSGTGRFLPMVTVEGVAGGRETQVHQRSMPVVVAPFIPPSPQNVVISSDGGDGVVIGWDTLPATGATYNVYGCIRRSETRPVLLAEGITDNMFDWDNLELTKEGFKAFFKVTAVVDGVESPFSAEVAWPVSEVSAPVLRIMPTTTDTAIDITWTQVPDTDRYSVNRYALFAATDLGAGNVVMISPGPGFPKEQTAFTYNPRPEETVLYLFVRTISDIGMSARSNEEVWIHSTMLDSIPTADVIVFPKAGPPPLKVAFAAPDCIDPDGFITGYYWRFFQGGPFKDYTSTYGAAEYTYTSPGRYVATLLVIDNDGNKFFKNAMISATHPPVAEASASVSGGSVPLTVFFDGAGSYDPDGEIRSWSWDFEGDETPDFLSYTGGAVEHTFTTPGTYRSRLTVTDNLGASASDTVIVRVADALGNEPPTAFFIVDREGGRAPLDVQFGANASFDPDGTIVTYSWDFDGDGTIDFVSPSPFADYTYSTPGVFFPRLTVTDNGGLTDWFKLRITVGVPIVLAPPSSPSASDGAFPDKVRVTWEHPAIGTQPDGYKVFRAGALEGPYALKGLLGFEDFFDDLTASPGTVYWYRIQSYKSGLPDSAPTLPESGFASAG